MILLVGAFFFLNAFCADRIMIYTGSDRIGRSCVNIDHKELRGWVEKNSKEQPLERSFMASGYRSSLQIIDERKTWEKLQLAALVLANECHDTSLGDQELKDLKEEEAKK